MNEYSLAKVQLLLLHHPLLAVFNIHTLSGLARQGAALEVVRFSLFTKRLIDSTNRESTPYHRVYFTQVVRNLTYSLSLSKH